MFFCFTGWFHSSGGGVAAGPRPGGFPPAGERHQREGPPACAAHRRTERRHQGCRTPPPERPQRWRGVQGTFTTTIPIMTVWEEVVNRCSVKDIHLIPIPMMPCVNYGRDFQCLQVSGVHQEYFLSYLTFGESHANRFPLFPVFKLS